MRPPRIRPITRKTRPVLWTLFLLPWVLYGSFLPDDWSFLHAIAAAVVIGLIWGLVIQLIAGWDDRRKGLTPPRA